ncbi:MAG: M15 family metallopeptidase [Peptococcaceae bacterium]|nr:M15 family metallopeptidase [Peptococcaceae bacterium]
MKEKGEEKQKQGRGLSWQTLKENPVYQLMLLPVSMVCVLGLLVLYGQFKPEEAAAQPLPEVTLAEDYETKEVPAAQPFRLDKGQLIPGVSYRGNTLRKYVTAADLHYGFMVLVNYRWVLPQDYEPRDMVVANDRIPAENEADFGAGKAGMKINATVLEQVQLMAEDAYEKDGVKGFLLGSTFRDFNYQGILYRNKLNYYKGLGYKGTEAEEKAAFWVARPYTSEHHTGLAIDIPSRSHNNLNGAYGLTENGLWLKENAWKYGFVVRYTEEKSDITQVGYEPWHIRYVGKPHSEILREKDWVLEEYVDYIRREGGLTYRCLDGSLWQVEYQKPAEEGYVLLPQIEGVSLSGDNIDGFIVTTPLSSVAMDEDPAIRLILQEEGKPDPGDGSRALDEDPAQDLSQQEIQG